MAAATRGARLQAPAGDARRRLAREQIRDGLRARHLSEPQLVAAARHGRSDTRLQLIDTFMPLIGSVARAYATVPGVDHDELMQEGVVGLLRALDRYDGEQGTPFWAYASWWVRQAMQQLVSELSRPVVLSDRALRQLALVRAVRRELVGLNGREPSRKELAEASGLSLEQVDRLSVADRQAKALDEPREQPDGPGPAPAESLPDQRAEDEYEELMLRLDASALRCLLERLSARQCSVIAGRFGLDGHERTLRDLAEELGVSAERVRQIEQISLEEMRRACIPTEEPSQTPTTLAS